MMTRDPSSPLAVQYSAVHCSNTTFASNKGGSTFCITSLLPCTDNQIALLLTNSTVVDNSVGPGSLVYFDTPTSFPSCQTLFSMDDATSESIRNSNFSSPIRSSYPYRLVLPASLPFDMPPSGSGLDIAFNFTIGAFWDVPIPIGLCSSYTVCFKADPILKRIPAEQSSDPNVVYCLDNGVFSLKFEIASDKVAPGDYNIDFGPVHCPASLQPRDLARGEANLRISITAPPSVGGSLSPTAIGFLVSLAFVVLAVMGFVLGLFLFRLSLRRQTRQPASSALFDETIPLSSGSDVDLGTLLASDGTLITQTIAELLQAAQVPIVDPEEIQVKEIIGSGATALVLFGQVRLLPR